MRDAGFERATLYRVLVNFAEVGILSRTDLGDHVWRFELHRDEHPHFICVDCGDVLCLPGTSLHVEGPKAPRALTKNEVQIQFKGRCDKCA